MYRLSYDNLVMDSENANPQHNSLIPAVAFHTDLMLLFFSATCNILNEKPHMHHKVLLLHGLHFLFLYMHIFAELLSSGIAPFQFYGFF